jgi:HK97 family phage major capsid protein
MPAEKITTVEQLNGFVAEIVKEVMNAELDDLRTQNQELIQRLRNMEVSRKEANAEKGLLAARFMRAVAAGKGDSSRAVRFAHKHWGDDADTVVKALEASDAEGGGVLIPTQWSGEVIELLKERTTVRRLGPRIIPMPTGSMQMSKLTGGATAGYIGESQNLPVTEQTFGNINLTWKKLAALIPVSNDLLRFNTEGADAIVRDDAVSAMATREDQAFLRDDGTQFTPKGLRHWVPAAHVMGANGTVNLANVTSDLAALILLLREANCRFLNMNWIMAPRTEFYLLSVRDGNGNFAYRDEMLRGTLWGIPYASTTEIPTNLGTGGDESEIMLADFADILLGESGTLEVMASDVAAYYDGTQVQAAFSLDQTVIRLIAHHDLAVRHEESLAVMNEVVWVP